MDKLWAQFQKPGAEWRGKPFWAWNGKLDKTELLRQVQVMKTMGFGGFFMHSRTGLVTEYLGREWFDLINACADEAMKLGMEAWLYDEDRWPSGLAGGLVTQHPQYRARSVVLEIMPAVAWSTLTWNKELLAVFLARVDGMSYSDCQRLNRRTPPAAGETRNLLVFRNMETKPSSFYNGYTYVDTLNPDATETFIRLTHEKYKRKCGSRIGRSIKGIFTDEPHRGRLMIKDDSDPQSAWSAPWTKKLPERFRSDFGYDLVDNLPDVFLRKDGAPVSQVKWHFVECLNRMFLDHFAKPYAEWCRKNKLLVTGHVLHEDNLGAQTAMNGSLMRYYEHMDYPGVDLLTRQNRCYWVAKQLASAARQLGRRWMLSEMYGCTGWDMPFSDHKALGDWQALFGINVRCPHLSWYTMEGEAKRDYPASMIHHSTWWDSYDTVERYFARIGILMAQGKPECDILVLNPVESIWCQIHPGWAIWLESAAPEMLPLEQAYRDLFHWLSGAQLDFDYGDEEMLSRMASLRRENGAPRLRVGHSEYRMIIVPKMVTIRETTLKLLQKFRDAGGEVLFTAEPPTHVDALPSSAPSEFAARCTRLPSPTGVSLDAAVAKILGTPAVRVLSSDGTPDARIMAQMRKGRGYSVVMLLNTDKEQAAENLRVRLRATGVIQEWNCLDGSRRIVPARRRGDTLEFTESFPAGGERLYVVTNEKESALPVRKPARSLGRLDWCGPIAYRLDEPNVCVLDWAQFRIGSGPWSEEMEILKADQAVRSKLDIALRGGEMLQPWWVNCQNKGRKDSKGRVSFRYSFNITEKPASGVDLALENPTNWTIRVNGIELDPGSATGWWVDVSLQRIPIPAAALKTGKNLVEIETDFHYGSNPEAMFILGNFGVTLKGRTRMIGKLPPTLNLGDITLQGLPFYSGKVAYSLPIPSPAPASRCQAIIRLPSIGGACAVVRVPDQEGIVIPWHPYEADITHLLQPGVKMLELEVVTTRRNSFGPLHEWPHSTTAVGPWSFLTEGERFREDYVLVPNGLLKPPELHWKTAR